MQCQLAHLTISGLKPNKYVPTTRLNSKSLYPHGVNDAKTATHPITLLMYAERRRKTVGALIAHVKFDKQKQQLTTASDKIITEIPAQLTPYTSCNKSSNPTAILQIFPDSGASICLVGPQHLEKLRVIADELISCFKRVTAVGEFQLICHGWLPIQF